MTGHAYNNSLYLFGGLIAPGWSDSTYLTFIIRYNVFSSEINNLKGGEYTNVTLPYHHMSVRIGAMVYLIGGVHNILSDKIHKYNLELDTLESAGTLRGLCAGGQAVTDGNWIYIIGGYNEQNRALNRMERYDPNLNQSYPGPELNYPRKESMAVIYENSIYVFGGKNLNEEDLPWVETLDLGALTASSRNLDSRKPVQQYRLLDNYPDPFNSTTVISFDLDDKIYLTLDIYSITGQHIKTLAEGEFSRGLHHLAWDGTDKHHKAAASNVYIYQIRGESFTQAKKMVLLR
jgi:N-acetylneuraminic acid mutarotase